MLCDRCKRRDANVHVTHSVNGAKFEQHLCAECAREEMEMLRNSRAQGSMQHMWDLLRHLGVVGLVVAPAVSPNGAVPVREVDLDALGLHLPEADETPAGANVLSLKAELESAVNSENFERAAKLRDEIYKLEHQG